MKRIIFVAALVCICGIVSAQKKGEMSIGGIVGVGTSLSSTSNISGSMSTTEKTPGTTTFNIAPEFSWFVADHCRLTFNIGYGLGSTPLSQDEDDKWLKNNLHLFQIGTGFSYFVRITDKFHFTPGVSFSGLFGVDKVDMDSSTDYTLNAAGFNFAITPAMVQFRPLQHFAFDISLISVGYTHIVLKDKSDKDSKVKNNNFDFDMAFQPKVGFHYYF